MIGVKVDVNTTELNKAITRLARDSSRTLSVIINNKLKFIVNKAIKLTKKASKEAIENIPDQLAGMLVNRDRAKQGLKGLNGGQMTEAVAKFKRIRGSHVNFVRMQWKWALLDLIKITGGTVSMKEGSRMGGSKPAPKSNTYTVSTVNASAWNDAKGGEDEVAYVTEVKLEGLQKAIDAETESTWEHIADKEYQRKVCDKFNR